MCLRSAETAVDRLFIHFSFTAAVWGGLLQALQYQLDLYGHNNRSFLESGANLIWLIKKLQQLINTIDYPPLRNVAMCRKDKTKQTMTLIIALICDLHIDEIIMKCTNIILSFSHDKPANKHHITQNAMTCDHQQGEKIEM